MRRRRLAATLALAAALVALTGCLERTIRITSEPPGAIVWLNDTELGRTPVETDFTFYGTYDVRLHLEGYEPVTSSREAKAPIYEYPGIDLVAEAIPTRIATLIEWNFALVPLAETNRPKTQAQDELLGRAREMRGTINEGTPADLPPAERPAAEPTPAEHPPGEHPSTGGSHDPGAGAPPRPPGRAPRRSPLKVDR